jgi:hypothetical protein
VQALSASSNVAFSWLSDNTNVLMNVEGLADYTLPYVFAFPAVNEARIALIRNQTLNIKRKIGVEIGYWWRDSVNL